jgi:AraC-like DNA-binding protein/mannose-6-phosphate isomerase-like protein (cupin superfamily)
MRQSVEPGPGVSVSSLAYEYPPACQVPEHAHLSDQLIYATSGVMEVAADQSLWLIPPQFAVWIPARVRHSIRMSGAVSMRSVYLRPGLARGKACAVIHVAPLLRELIVEAVRIGNLKTRSKSDAAFRDVLVAQIGKASPVPTALPMPSDARAMSFALAIVSEPGGRRTLDAQCRDAGVSARTMQRIFRREVGTDFATWRRQARLMKAVEMLAAGRSIKEVSFAVGYRQASTFMAMFRRTFGLTPKAWISSLKDAA